jgi:hypothetical protein
MCGWGGINRHLCTTALSCCWAGDGPTDFNFTYQCYNPGPPATPAPSQMPVGKSFSRVVAFTENWKECPTFEQLVTYTHVVWAFAISYTYAAGGNLCRPDCKITVDSCTSNPDLAFQVSNMKAHGISVLLSFGGDGMNSCWAPCIGRQSDVVAQLVQLVTQYGFNGVDINFEGDLRSKAQQDFLIGVTKGLAAQLPMGSVITNTPMDIQTVVGHPYNDVVLPAVKNDLSFLMIQYYNGIINPTVQWDEMRVHYRSLLSKFFGNDPTRLVAGVCLNVCGDFDVNSEDSLVVIENLETLGTPTGGIFFWASSSNAYCHTPPALLPISAHKLNLVASCCHGHLRCRLPIFL